MVRRVFFACVFCLLASSSLADDAAQANRLMIEAVQLIQASEGEPSAEGKFKLLKKAHDNLVEIIEHHPSSDLAVRLATGQRIGNISLAAVRKAMDQARVIEPRKAGAPAQIWRHGAAVVAVASSPSGGRWVLTASRDGIAALHDVETGELLSTWQHRSEMSAAALSPRGRRVLTASRDGVVALRHTRTGNILNKWQHERGVRSVALSLEKGQALVGDGRAAVLIDVGSLEIQRSWRHKSPVTIVAYAPDGRWVLAGFADGRALLGEAGTGKTLHTWNHRGSGGGGVTSAAFSPDGRRVLTGAANTMAVMYDVATGKTLHKWRLGSPVTTVAYSRNGRWVLTGDDGYEVELHETKTGKTLHKWRYDDSPTALAFSANDRQALMGFADGIVILCDIQLSERRRGYTRTYLTRNGGCW